MQSYEMTIGDAFKFLPSGSVLTRKGMYAGVLNTWPEDSTGHISWSMSNEYWHLFNGEIIYFTNGPLTKHTVDPSTKVTVVYVYPVEG